MTNRNLIIVRLYERLFHDFNLFVSLHTVQRDLLNVELIFVFH